MKNLFGFVGFMKKSKVLAIERLDGMVIRGCKINVKEAAYGRH